MKKPSYLVFAVKASGKSFCGQTVGQSADIWGEGGLAKSSYNFYSG